MAKYDVFISYSRKDMAVANRLCDALDKLGVSYWIDRNIHGSANFLSEITRYIRNCRVVVFIASPNSAQSEWTQKEILFALKHKKEIIPYRIGNFHFEDNDELDFVFTNVQWIESEAAVVSALKELGCTFSSTPAPTPAPKPVTTPKPPRNPINWRKWIKSSAIGTFAVALVALFAYALFAPDTNIVSSYSVDSVSIMEARLAKAEAERKAHEEAARNKIYQVGDYYNDGTKEGVVFEVSADGKHGKIVSMTQSREGWSSYEAEQKRLIGADSKTDGAYNMAKVKAVANWQQKYPAFKWCADLGEGWYLPSFEELKKFMLDNAIHDAVNRTLTSKGGVKLFNRGNYAWYWSSTESDEQWSFGEFCAWVVGVNGGTTGNNGKNSNYYVRAVATFGDASISTVTLSRSCQIGDVELVYVVGGTFMMGSDDYKSIPKHAPKHSVTLSDFYIGKYEVTQAQWRAVMGSNPSYFKGDDLPVENVSWNDVQEFIKKLNTQTGKKYRLPTEAEWEYAARGGNKSKYYKYSGSDNIGDVAWYSANSGGMTHPVGEKQHNELGIYDMSGNVWEWCSDWYDDYSSNSQINPKGPNHGDYRVLRGGDWGQIFWENVYSRTYANPIYGRSYNGFRLACSRE